MGPSRKHFTLHRSAPPKIEKSEKTGKTEKTEKVVEIQETAEEIPQTEISITETITALNDCPPLLRVPSEIRREIFRYIVPSSTKKFRLYTGCDSTVVGTKWNRELKSNPDKLCLAILRTNRLIYYEALSVLYSENLFHFIGFNYLPVLDFIRRLSPDAKNLVRKVRLTLLTDQQGLQPANHDNFCAVIHDFLPGLTTLQADPWVFI